MFYEQHEGGEVSQSVGQFRVGKLVAHATASGEGTDETTAAQAGEVVGDVAAAEVEALCQV